MTIFATKEIGLFACLYIVNHSTVLRGFGRFSVNTWKFMCQVTSVIVRSHLLRPTFPSSSSSFELSWLSGPSPPVRRVCLRLLLPLLPVPGVLTVPVLPNDRASDPPFTKVSTPVRHSLYYRRFTVGGCPVRSVKTGVILERTVPTDRC